jgi:transposase
LAVERVVLTALGTRVVQLVTNDPDAARCPGCRAVSTSGKDWVLTRPHDLPCGGGQLAVQWRKRRWRCRTTVCPQRTFTEQVAQVPAGMRTTTRLRTALAVAVEDGRDQSEVAAAHQVSWPTVQRAVVDHAAAELVEPEPVRVLGMDETRFGRPRWLPDGVHPDGRIRWRRTDPWETGFVDITGDQALLGQVDGRTSAAVQAWLAARTEAFRAGIEVVVIDPNAGYAAAVVRAALPDAAIAVDHFHLVVSANRAVTAVRERVTRDLLDRRGRKDRPDLGEPPVSAARARTALGAGVGADVERLRRQRSHGGDPLGVDRQGGTPRCARPPAAVGTPARSASGSGRSTGGAPMRRSRS